MLHAQSCEEGFRILLTEKLIIEAHVAIHQLPTPRAFVSLPIRLLKQNQIVLFGPSSNQSHVQACLASPPLKLYQSLNKVSEIYIYIVLEYIYISLLNIKYKK